MYRLCARERSLNETCYLSCFHEAFAFAVRVVPISFEHLRQHMCLKARKKICVWILCHIPTI